MLLVKAKKKNPASSFVIWDTLTIKLYSSSKYFLENAAIKSSFPELTKIRQGFII